MSRVHCIDCGSAVVVDPSGFCPEGHHLGTDGARIDAAIGVAVPYPDEPEPWVAAVDLVDEGGPAASDHSATQPRAARPPSAPSGEQGFASPPQVRTPSPTRSATSPFAAADDGSPAGAPAIATTPPSTNGHGAGDSPDDLLRELHSLSELSGLDDRSTPATPTTPAPAASSPASSTSTFPTTAAAGEAPPPATTPPPTTAPQLTTEPEPDATGEDTEPPPTSGQHRDGLAELRALEAAVHALTGSSMDELDDTPPEAPEAADGVVHRLPAPAQASPQETPDRDELAEVEQLFAHRPGRGATDEPAPRPSQTTPPAENEPPRPAFQRTAWSTAELDDGTASTAASTSNAPAVPEPSASHPAAPPPAATATPQLEPRTARSEVAAPSGSTLDIGNFTAKGKRVGPRGEGKRRRRGR